MTLEQIGRAGPLPYALACAKKGWYVLPLKPKSKIPEASLVPHGVKDASVDPRVLRRWFASHGRPGGGCDLNLGLACGKSGIVVVDVDPRNGGLESMESLVGQHGALPTTVCAETGGGGFHFLFKAPRAATDPSTGELGEPLRLRGKLATGIDLKHGDGYIVIPPSIHPDGPCYLWRASSRPSLVALAEMPSWMLGLALVHDAPPVSPPRLPRSGTAPIDRASRYLATMAGSVSGQGGHDALWHATVALVRGFSLSADEALHLLTTEFNPRCLPAWSYNALRHKVESAGRDSRTPLGYLLEAPRRK